MVAEAEGLHEAEKLVEKYLRNMTPSEVKVNRLSRCGFALGFALTPRSTSEAPMPELTRTGIVPRTERPHWVRRVTSKAVRWFSTLG
jgi:hypothetical protein